MTARKSSGGGDTFDAKDDRKSIECKRPSFFSENIINRQHLLPTECLYRYRGRAVGTRTRQRVLDFAKAQHELTFDVIAVARAAAYSGKDTFAAN